MGKILSLTASVIIILVFIYAFTKKSPVRLDANGFPINPKLGDTFVKDSVQYIYSGTSWVKKPVVEEVVIKRISSNVLYNKDGVSLNTNPNQERKNCPKQCLELSGHPGYYYCTCDSHTSV